MAYNEMLAERVRKMLSLHAGITERKMFGGISFMLGDNMCCGVVNDDLVVRVSPGSYVEALAEPSARPMDFTGRPLRGFVFVGPEGFRTDEALEKWIVRAMDFASSLPPK
jgi:TfoX/Sxy family transcriptional regulator of competence genes